MITEIYVLCAICFVFFDANTFRHFLKLQSKNDALFDGPLNIQGLCNVCFMSNLRKKFITIH